MSARALTARPNALRASPSLVFAACCFVVAAWGCVEASPVERASPRLPTVVLISLDGTRPADLNSSTMPNLVAVGAAGFRAAGLMPVDPSNTFPNHVSLATGVHPETHRLVNNAFIDPDRGRFDRSVPHEWIESEPIWSIAERHGLRAASYYWVGSEGPWTGGPAPSDTRRFSSRTGEKKKVDQILAWLMTPDEASRPRLIVAWFHGGDHAGHVSGPGAPAVARALAPQDREIGRLVSEMERAGLFETTTLLFVSDHGMVGAERRVDLKRALRRAGLDVSVLGIGGFSSITFDDVPDEASLARAVEVARAEGLSAYVRTEAPAAWHVGDSRFGHVVVRAPLGTAIVTPTTLIEGFHGYDAREDSMAGLFVGRGRGIRPGTTLERVSNLAVAPTVLTLLGIPTPAQMKAAPIAALVDGLPKPSGAKVEVK